MSIPSQHMIALDRANEVRMARAQLKRDIRTGQVSVLDILASPPEHAHTMRLYDLLTAMPMVGKFKADAVMRRLHCSAAKTVGEMSERQRLEVAATVAA